MGKLTFVGLGLGSKGISLEGMQAIKEADTCYLEYYTTPHEPTLLNELEKGTGKVLTVVDREFVEDGREILREARGSKLVLAVPGDPMIATTHNDLRLRAINQGTETGIVHAATIASSAASISGLHYYKFGRTMTVTRESIDSMQEAYHAVHKNLQSGLHTLLLLEFDVEDARGASPSSAIEGLLQAEENFKRKVISEDTLAIVISRLGRGDADSRAGNLNKLERVDYGRPPHSLIIPGSLHFTEVEALAAIFRIDKAWIRDNSHDVKRTAEVLLPRYVANTRGSLESARKKVGKQYEALLENVALYLNDAENFLVRGEDELAMLNVGYAEGLLDALGFAEKIETDR